MCFIKMTLISMPVNLSIDRLEDRIIRIEEL